MQQQFVTTLEDMRGHIRRVRPGIDPNTVRDFLNQQVRSVLDRKAIWAGLIRRGVISIPSAYTTGTVAFTSGSDVVTGTDTAWAVSDVVNTTVAAAVTEVGLQWVTPASMAGIDVDSALYVDGAGTPEVVTVVAIQATRFLADFRQAHSASFTLTASSLTGRQLRVSNQYPIYTVKAITSTTGMILDMAWAGTSLASTGYSVILMYVTLAPNMKHLIDVVDPVQPLQLTTHYSHRQLNFEDPQRIAGGPPYVLADMGPSPSGNMQYEIYPPQTAARQLHYIYTIQWPDMIANGDRPPFFINPNVFIYGALAQALRMKVSDKDVGYDPGVANQYERMAERDLAAAQIADDGKVQAQMDWEYQRIMGGRGSTWSQSHAVSGMQGGMWW